MNATRCFRALAGVGLMLALAAPLRAAEIFASVFLSEVLVQNQRGLVDEQGERSGWIELQNGGVNPVNLAGWFLTDTPTNLTQWRLPGVVLPPGKFQLVFASGKNRTNILEPLHTSFRLDPKGNYLALVNRATNIDSSFPLSPPTPDISEGRVRGEPALRGRFAQPTPGKPNAIAGPGFAPGVDFSRPGGNYISPFTVELSTPGTGALIRFTLDGTFPTSRSPIYEAPLTLTNCMQIRARAFQDGLLPGPPRSETYVRLFTNVLSFTSTLPVLILDTLGREEAVSGQGSFVHCSLHEPVGGVTSLTNPPTLRTRADFRVRGSSSSGLPQPPFALEFIDEFNEERPQAWLGLPSDSAWVLYAPNSYDPVLIHNPFIHELSREMGRYSSRTRFVEVFVARNARRLREAHYHGLYVLEEKIKIGRQRVNIDRLGASDLKPPEVTGGYLLKFDRLGPGEAGLSANGDRGLVYVEPKEQTITLPQRAPQREYIRKYLARFERALQGPEWRDPVRGYRAYLDAEAAIDFHVLEVLSGNVDALVLSTYFHKPRGGKIVYGPHWDFDRALGSTDERDANPRQWNTGPFFDGTWWRRLFSDVDFWQQWVDRWQAARATYFSLSHLHGLIDRLAGELRDAQPRQYKRWNFQPRGGSYQSEIQLMKDWLSNRVDFIDEQLVATPQIRPATGPAREPALTLQAPARAAIYYTLDGSDPRAPGGGVASNALTYASAVPLKAGDRFVARARDLKQRQSGGPPVSTPWSGPLRTNFVAGPP